MVYKIYKIYKTHAQIYRIYTQIHTSKHQYTISDNKLLPSFQLQIYTTRTKSIMESLCRILVTYIRSSKYVGKNELESKLQIIVNELELESVPDLDDLIDQINLNLHILGFKIEKTLDEITNELIYVFSNEVSNGPADKALTTFNVGDLQIIKSIIEEIFTNNYHLKQDTLVNNILLHRQVAKTSKDLRNLISQLLNLGYIEILGENVIPSPRLVVELKDYLSKYNPMNCSVCKNIVTRGVRVGDAEFHYKCFEIYSRTNEVDQSPEIIGLPVESLESS